jgi:hypothetical protein
MAREADALQEVAYVAARAHRAARDAWSARVAEAEKRADDAYAAAELANGSGQAEADYQAALANLRAVRAL